MEQTKLKTGPTANQPAIQDALQVMQAFSGAYKKRNLYSAHHSVYQDAIRNLKNALDRFMEHYGNMHLQVEREAILYEGEVVYEGAKQTNDLVFILRRDGVLWFEFKKGLEIEEIETFVTLLHEHCVLEEEPEEDIVTALWANRLPSISFEAADLELGLDDDIDIAALPCCPADFETATDEDDEDKQASDTPSACAIEENEPDRLQDCDELFKLAEDDREQLEKMIAEEKKIDGSNHVVDVLLYIIETHCTPQDVGDLLKYMVQAMEEALLKQRFSQLSNVLTRIKRHLDEFRSIEHWSADHLEQFIQTLSSGAFLEHLLKVSPDIDLAPQENLNALKKIILFFRLADQSAKHEDPSGWLAERLRENDIVWITPAQTPIKETGADSPSPDELAVRKAKVRKSYANVLSSIRETAHKLSAKKGVGFRNSVRMVQNMVDLIEQDESLFLGISTIRIYDDYTYAHSLNVAILAMCLGKHIGLNHIMLERLGLCGLFHDLGKIEIPKEVLNKKGALSDEEYDLIKTHSMHSARLILRIKAASDRKNKILVPPFEHHMGYDRSGYPDAKTGRRISLFGRILTIADVYDAITSPRVYRKEAMSPDKALAQMISQSGTHFDPVLLKVFIRMLRAYPTGTLVKLDNGEMGIVTSYSNNADYDRPVLQLLVKDAEKKYKKGAVVDLSQRDSETGRYDYTIVKTMHPSTIGVQAAAFII